MITNSFIEEVETEVNQRKKMDTELRDYNKSNFAPRAPGISLGGVKSEDDDEEESVIAFDDSGKGTGFFIMIIIVIIALGAGGWWGYENYIKKAPGVVVESKPEVVDDGYFVLPAVDGPWEVGANLTNSGYPEACSQAFIVQGESSLSITLVII